MLRIFGMTILGFLLCFAAAVAKAAPSEDDLKKTMQEMEEAKERQKKLAANAGKLAKEQESLQQALVERGSAIQRIERDLIVAEDKLNILNTKKREIEADAKARQQQLGALTEAALRLSGAPPVAAVMMPQDTEESLSAARTVAALSDSIKRESEELNAQLSTLKELSDKVEDQKKAIQAKQEKLADDRVSLSKELSSRKALHAALNAKQEAEAARVAELGKKAASLKDLLNTIEKERKEKEEDAKKTAKKERKGNMRSFAKAKGDIRPPVAGKVVANFGANTGGAEKSRGLTIAARAGSQVSAPYDGEVVFTGPFLDYGNIVILRHSDDFHTLLAGFSSIDVETGQFLLEGEPIGVMGDGTPANLYVELREHHQPVDPAPWIAGLRG